MPVYSVKEFADLTSKKPKDIHTYAVRGKIVKNDKKQIDTTNPINLAFFEANHIDREKPKINGTTKQKVKDYANPVEPSSHQLVIQEKAKVELEVKKKDLEAKELELKKKRGELIDAEQTINIVGTHFDTFKRELDQNIQVFVQDMCARHGIEPGKAGEYKLKVAELINKANAASVDLLMKQFK